ncbi:helix-turn-helix domain-containing protein [Paenibacillus donghaensis]|uniref:Helix-turn-helix domain-containing protein n=1 Tax=Paenibacillus donghaensis TaxID=414771 RepID=A0A2Z2K5C7_9BACL|nr:helix-turn-helix domain-containing protein [Paenibacillus donghaensis]ASA21286.1 hypothetical protein B9T62_11110 [Paenibacillus donghaensis]
MPPKKKKNFFTAPNDSFEIGLNPFQIAVYLYLTRCSNNSDSAFPSFSTIALKSGMGERKAKEVVKELVEMGLIKKQQRWGEKGRQSNVYQVVEPAAEGNNTSPQREGLSAPDALTLVHDMHNPSAPHAQYKELYINNQDKNIKRYIDLPIDDHVFLNIYNAEFKRSLKKEHPKITEEQLQHITYHIELLQEWEITVEEFREQVRDHFETLAKKNNGSILAFIPSFMRRFEIPYTGFDG